MNKGAIALGLDIGTTSTIGILIAAPDRVLAMASRPVTLHSPKSGWAEEDPEEWWRNLCDIVPDLLAQAGCEAGDIKAIGVAGMLPAVVLLDGEDRLIRRSIQQSDGRCGAEVRDMRAEIDESAFIQQAGNGLNQQLVGAKLRWLARHEPKAHARIATVFGSYDFINSRLTGEKTVEQNWALEAGVTDLRTGTLSQDLAERTGVPWHALPRRVESHAIQGRVTEAAAQATGLAAGTPVVGGAADMIASALGAGITRDGDVLLKFGGAVDILTASRAARPDPRLFLDYHLVPGLFMPNGCMSTGGAVLNWVVRTLGGGLDHRALDVLAADRPAGSDDLSVLPYFLGEKTPIHDPAARGIIEGLTLSHDIGHIWRATLESYGYALRHHIDVLQDMGHRTERFIVSDGGSISTVWMQIVADILARPLNRLSGHPGSCLGAAWTALVGTGQAEWGGISAFTGTAGMLTPNPAHRETYDRGYARFRDLYRRLQGLRE